MKTTQNLYIQRPNSKWNAHSHHIKAFFGLDPKKKWPAEGMRGQYIQGIWVFVMPLDECKELGMFHRVMATCPSCNKVMSAGRMHQHVCKK